MLEHEGDHTRVSSDRKTWEPRPHIVDKIEATLFLAIDSDVWLFHISNGAQE